MTEQKTFRLIFSFTVSATLTVLFIVGITIAAELFIPIKKWLAVTFNHHWVGKGVLSVVFFAVASAFSFFLVRSADDKMISRAQTTLVRFVVFGTIVLCAFFFYESFAH